MTEVLTAIAWIFMFIGGGLLAVILLGSANSGIGVFLLMTPLIGVALMFLIGGFFLLYMREVLLVLQQIRDKSSSSMATQDESIERNHEALNWRPPGFTKSTDATGRDGAGWRRDP